MKYTEKDLKEGMKLRCTKSTPPHWSVGKLYEVSLDKDITLSIKDNDGSTAYSQYILDCLNGTYKPVEFEIFEYPTATITVDIEQQLNDRIELLHKERMNIIDKIERMESQRCKLRDKIQKLSDAKKALEILKEFK